MDNPENIGTRFSGIRWAVFSVVFFGIPLVLIWLGFHNFWRDIEAKEQRRLDERLERVVAGFDQFRLTEEFVTKIFQVMVERVFLGQKNPEKTFALYRKQIHSRFPDLFEFTYVDKNGEALPELCDRPPPLAILRQFAIAVKAKSQGGNERLLKEHWNLFKGFLGSLMQPEQIYFFSLKMASHQDKRHFVIMSPWYSKGMLIAHVNLPPNWDSLATLDRANFFNHHSKRFKAVVIDETNHLKNSGQDFGVDSDELKRVIASFTALPRAVLRFGESVWAHSLISPTVKVFVRSPPVIIRGLARKKILLHIVLIALFFLLSFPTWMAMSGRWLPYISIRQKLVGLFLYMVALPLAFMSLAASDYLSEKRVVLEKQVHDEMEKSLLLFDHRMPRIIGELDRTIKHILGSVIPPGAPLRETMVARMKRFSAKMGLDAGYLLDENCEASYVDGSINHLDERNLKLLKPIYANLFRSYNHIDNAEDFKDSQVFKIGSAGGIDVEALYADLATSLGRLVQFNFTGKRMVRIMLPISDSTGRVRFLLSTGWIRTLIEEKYLEKYMLASCRQLEDTRWIAINKKTKQIFLPTSFKKMPQIEAFAARVSNQEQTVRDNIDLRGNRYLLTGISAQELSNIDLVAITSDRFIHSEICRLQWMVGIVSLAILLTGATVGTLLARKFLEPIGNLAEGVTSLRRRQFEKRLPILDCDELGDLSQTFNEMMEGMADLEVARIVQESLFPTKSISLVTFDIHGTCVSATQAGGDYYDFFLMPDGQLMLVVGDVSGHGVGAAMVMAMAKALVAHLVTKLTNPAEILENLHMTLLRVLNRRKMMSCFIALLDVKERKMTFANAGHNDPFVVRGIKTIPILGIRSFPLGAAKRNNFSATEFSFEIGDQFILYTDGLIEAEALDNQAVGYERFLEVLPSLMGDSAAATEDRILSWHRQIVKPGPQADDITVVVARVN
ncbi:MAG: SpoIIE family protein phosphatase [Candidatus Riflebacteria bacterium]|nr:SpoIIE family protein phosphatase [Candidatus Riflebacteria bacterium]